MHRPKGDDRSRPNRGFKVALEHRINDDRTEAAARKIGQTGADGIRATRDIGEIDQPDPGRALARQHPHQIGVVHRIERMILQRTSHSAAASRRTDCPDRRCGRSRETPASPARWHRRTRRRSASITGPILPASVESKVEQILNNTCVAPRSRSHCSAARERVTASRASIDRLLSDTTTASTSGNSRFTAGTPMVCTVRRPLRVNVLARSEAPV